jgi:hypothetical protein
MRRRFILSECERRNRSGVPPRSAWVKFAGPLPVNVSLLGAPGLRPGAPFLAFGGRHLVTRLRKGRMIPAVLRPFQKNVGLLAGAAF